MLIVRSPLRISLGGGGTDLKSYYAKQGGWLIAGAINKYIYISLNTPFEEKKVIKYTKIEDVDDLDAIKHPIFRESIREMNFMDPVELTSTADIPAGTGLGSSGAFTAALLYVLSHKKRQIISKKELAELACKIEIDILNEPIGKQDQYISAFGGLTCFEYEKDGRVNVNPLNISPENIDHLEDNLLLFFTGYSRSASSILTDQETRSRENDNEILNRLDLVKKRGLLSKKALVGGDFEAFAAIMHDHWLEKQSRTKGMSNDRINEWYNLGIQNGASGGKLIGAGGGGFLMFYARDREKLRAAMQQASLKEVRFRFDFEGTKILVNE